MRRGATLPQHHPSAWLYWWLAWASYTFSVWRMSNQNVHQEFVWRPFFQFCKRGSVWGLYEKFSYVQSKYNRKLDYTLGLQVKCIKELQKIHYRLILNSKKRMYTIDQFFFFMSLMTLFHKSYAIHFVQCKCDIMVWTAGHEETNHFQCNSSKKMLDNFSCNIICHKCNSRWKFPFKL